MPVDEAEMETPTRDYAKWVWGGIALMFLGMLGTMFFLSKPGDVNRSAVHARHILIKFNPAEAAERQQALDLISDLRQRILNGESFAKLAKEWSQDNANASRGGDLGYQFKGSFEPNFEDAVWNLPLGQLSEIISTAHGFHILEVLERNYSELDRYQLEIEEKVDSAAQGK